MAGGLANGEPSSWVAKAPTAERSFPGSDRARTRVGCCARLRARRAGRAPQVAVRASVSRRSHPRCLPGVDDEGKPVAVSSGSSPTGRPAPWSVRRHASCPTRRIARFVALAGGGALAVAVPNPTTEAALAGVGGFCRRRCSSSLAISWFRNPLPKGGLVGAVDGSPWLWNGQRWFRFDPWRARFVVPQDAPDDGPTTTRPRRSKFDPGSSLGSRGSIRETRAASRLRGFRHSVRGPLTRDIFFWRTRPTRLGSTARDRARRIRTSKPPPDELHRNARPRVVVTDTLYGDFDLQARESPMRAPRDEIGGATCNWPSGGRDCPSPCSAAGERSRRRRQRWRNLSQRTCGRVGIAFGAPPFSEKGSRRSNDHAPANNLPQARGNSALITARPFCDRRGSRGRQSGRRPAHEARHAHEASIGERHGTSAYFAISTRMRSSSSSQ